MRYALAFLLIASPAAAFTPEFPGPSSVTLSQTEALDSFDQPTGPWVEGGTPTARVEGRVTRTAWRIEPPMGFTTLSMLVPLREILQRDGWQVIFECETDGCGGFDFRYGLDLFAEPEMHVDLGDFRYLSARRGDERIGLMVSRTASLGFVQAVMVGEGVVQPVIDAPEPVPNVVTEVLEGLDFASGAATLVGDQPVLDALAGWLRENPDRTITLVGHTDASGALEANIAVSRQRAEAVRAWLVAAGIDGARIDAQGVGYLAPRDTNATPEGQARNRRVEVIRN